MHILFLNSWYPSRVLPVNGDFIQRHAETMAMQHRITSIHVITDEKISKDELSDKVINGVRTLIYYLKPVSSEIKKHILFFNKYMELFKLSGHIDLIHVNRIFPAGMVALYLNRTRSIPYIITEHYTGYLNYRSEQLSKTELLFTENIVKRAKVVCPVSKNLEDNMIRLGFQGNYQNIPNVVDTAIFKPDRADHKRFTLTHISSLVNDHKNISGILRTISKLQNHIPDLLFYLIGYNPFQYQDEISQLKIKPQNIILINQIPYREVASYLQQTDLLLMFSNYENLPCVILEAFACGVPVISTDVGGISEYFPDEFGKLVSKGDENEFFNKILNFYNEKKKPDKNKMNAFAEKHFSKTAVLSEYTRIYHQILKDHI